MIRTRSVQDLYTFTSFLNDIHSTIKFTCENSFTSIPFLDVNVSLHNGKIVTALKPTDKHQYLLHSSCQPIHTRRAVPFSLALRLRRICSTNETFTPRTNELIDYLHKRGYNRYFLQREIQRVNNITRTEALTPLTLPHWTNQNVFLCYHLQPSPSFHLIHYSQTLSHPYFIPPLLQRL